MRILIVEDEIKIAKAIKRGLEIKGYVVDDVHDSDEAYSAVNNTKYDLLVLDRMLPGELDGIGLLKILRKEKKLMPIIMLTAKGTIGDKIEGLDSGADDYLVKPFSFDELTARVNALLRRPALTLSDIIKFEDLTLDRNLFIAKRNNKQIKLTNKEFYLLEFLMRHQGQIVTKEMIINNIWSDQFNVMPNTVEVYIASLRNKVDRPFNKNKELIQTVRGFGYRLG